MNSLIKSITTCMTLLGLALMHQATAQPNVNVDTHTGTGSVSIPIHSIQEGGFSVPISLGYSASGVRVTDVSGTVGMNWYLSAGGNISREVRGLPDDLSTTGWLHNGVGTTIENFVTNGTESATYLALEALDVADDTDPDIFSINTPFVSGRFFFDNDGLIQLETHQDLKIDYQLSSGALVSFTITDAGGIRYVFALSDVMKEAVDFDAPEVYFKRMQEQYGTAVTYRTNWHLTSILLPNGSAIGFTYTNVSSNNIEARKSWLTGAAKTYEFEGAASGSFGKKYFLSSNYLIKEIRTPSGDRATFDIASRNDEIVDHKLTGIQLYRNNDQLVKEYDLFYTRVIPSTLEIDGDPADGDIELTRRTFLSSIHQRSQTEVLPGYTFNYYGVDRFYVHLPITSSTATDFWGYYNGNTAASTDIMKLYVYPGLTADNKYRAEPLPAGHAAKASEIVVNGKDGTVNPETIHYGSLSKVTYPTGGNTRLYYEPNEYYDPEAATSYLGSGIRVSKTITHDGVSNKNNITTTYSYDQTGTSTTSGLMVERPKFAFGTPYLHDVSEANNVISNAVQSYATLVAGSTPYTYLTIRTNFNLIGGRNSAVRYTHAEVKQTGKGKVTYDYLVPAALDDTSVNSEWSPTNVQIARGTIAGGYEAGYTQTGFNVYPLSYNPNYGFERGLLEKTEARNEQGDLVSSTIYQYARIYKGSSTDFTYGLDYDKLPTYEVATAPPTTQTPAYFYAFGKYKLFANLSNALSKKTDRIYDPADPNKIIETITDYTYSTVHKKVSEVTTTNSDGTIQKQHLIYPEDYSIQKSAGDAQVKVLDSMIARNILALPIEQYTTAQEVGEALQYTSGSLTLFSDFSAGKVLPHQQYVLKTPQSSLSISSVNNSGATSVFSFDSNYELVSTIEGYDANDNPTTTIGRNQIYSGVHWGYERTYPHATVANAKAEEVSYTGFETTTGHELNFDDAQYPTPYTTGRTGAHALLFASGISKKLSATLSKGNTNKYLLSLWISQPAAAGTISAALKDDALTTTYATETLSFTNDQSWTYYEIEIDVSTCPAAFVIELTSNQALTLDDVLFHPENARVSYSSLGNKYEVLSATSPLGITQYLEYDGLLRNTVVRDDDKNIVSVNEYTDRQIEKPVNPYFHYRGSNCNGDAVFEYDEPDPTGYTYYWYFGEEPNLIPVTDNSGGSTFTHDYSSNGNYNVRLLASKNGKSANSYQTLNWNPSAKSVSICAAGPQRIDACTGAVKQVFNDGCYTPSGTQLAQTIFTVGEIENCYDCTNLTYDWEVSQNGGSTWTNVGTATSTTVSLGYLSTYQVRCKITTSCSSPETITSNTKTVVIYESVSSCPNEITY